MQLKAPPGSEIVEVLPPQSGFTLVEEDDVAFTLSLCREVHRIYGQYQEGVLTATEPFEAGLMVTLEALATLGQQVTTGMPAMRLTVAAAQTTEMLAVLFDADPLKAPVGRSLRERYRAIVTERSYEAVPLPLEAPAPPPHAKERFGPFGLFRRRRR